MIGHSGDVQYLSDSSTKKVWKVCFFLKKCALSLICLFKVLQQRWSKNFYKNYFQSDFQRKASVGGNHTDLWKKNNNKKMKIEPSCSSLNIYFRIKLIN